MSMFITGAGMCCTKRAWWFQRIWSNPALELTVRMGRGLQEQPRSRQKAVLLTAAWCLSLALMVTFVAYSPLITAAGSLTVMAQPAWPWLHEMSVVPTASSQYW